VVEENIKILIIDDDDTVVDTIMTGLELDNFDVFAALTGRRGIEKVKEVHPDVVLLDLKLPDIDGFEVLRQIRSEPENTDIHIIMITGDLTIDIDKAFAYGADDCIIKPIDIKYLVSRIEKNLKKKYRVLVIEDDRQICEILQNVLEKNGYHVDIYNDGRDLVENINNDQPDIILLDITLPVGPDGIELCKAAKENKTSKNIPVIMLTSNEYANMVEKCFSYGAADYIFKPFNMSELLVKMKRYLRISNRTK